MPQGKRHIKKKQVLRDLDIDYWFNHNSNSTVVGIVCYCWEAEIIISQGENGQCFIFPGLLWRKHWEANSIHFFFCYCGQAKLHWMNTTEPPCRSSYSGRLSWIPRAAVWAWQAWGAMEAISWPGRWAKEQDTERRKQNLSPKSFRFLKLLESH